MLALLVVGAVLLFAQAASASCPPPEDPRDTLAGVDAAFIGELVSRRPAPDAGPHREDILTFRVRESVKGGLGELVEVRAARGFTVSLSVPEGQEVGLFLYRRGGDFIANACGLIAPRHLRVAARGGPTVKRATDRDAKVSFRLRGRRLTVTVARDAPVVPSPRRRLSFSCGVDVVDRRDVVRATGQFAPGRRRVTVLLPRNLSRRANFCGLAFAGGASVARVFFFAR